MTNTIRFSTGSKTYNNTSNYVAIITGASGTRFDRTFLGSSADVDVPTEPAVTIVETQDIGRKSVKSRAYFAIWTFASRPVCTDLTEAQVRQWVDLDSQALYARVKAENLSALVAAQHDGERKDPDQMFEVNPDTAAELGLPVGMHARRDVRAARATWIAMLEGQVVTWPRYRAEARDLAGEQTWLVIRIDGERTIGVGMTEDEAVATVSALNASPRE